MAEPEGTAWPETQGHDAAGGDETVLVHQTREGKIPAAADHSGTRLRADKVRQELTPGAAPRPGEEQVPLELRRSSPQHPEGVQARATGHHQPHNCLIASGTCWPEITA